ncbi:structural maintenance of chromosomes protein 3 [Periconia macrospinosa]|uniref:Structural maintenance of chromosomes protein n=1 Tax=Periconia macrospinosa TaxID=97972 RepID=A0A2V1E837_9PLEO|nr:structural maintenance of chromosomes protein 3 [Periconia macrospinosa]
MGYIKQITIQGFKSYKDQTKIEPFSPKTNIVVGRNGAGKSNFFAAVRFVLGDDYENLGREERQALLHEGSGSAVMSAYVEVVFDNTDGRFQNNNKPEFVLRRTIGAKKDEYSMDRKNATKREVFDMLEAAGLSRSNPFYIVPQGRVTAITNMKDEERLNLLKEISGSNVYEKRRTDSLKLMSETENRCERIDDLVNDINLRLSELEGEKKELEAWNKSDRERRALLYTMNARQEAELQEKIENIDAFRHNGVADVDGHNSQFRETEQEIADIDAEIGELKSELEMLAADRAQLEEERNDAARQKAAIEIQLNDLSDGQSAAQQAQRQRDTQIKKLQKDIGNREKELRTLLPEYEAKKAEEMEIRSQLAEAVGQQKRLEDKQGRTATYTNKRQRDDALRARIAEISVDLATRKSIQMQTSEDIIIVQEDIVTLEADIVRIESELDNEGDNTITLAEQLQKAKDKQDTIRDRQNNLFREERRIHSQVENAERQLHIAEREFSHLLDHATSRGLETLRRLQKQHNLAGVHGTIAELLEVSDMYKIAAEVAAGPALFHVVVDNDSTAEKVINLLSKEKGGRLTCIPLSRVRARQGNVPHTADAQPLLPKLKYDAKYTKAFSQVFGNVVVCPELSICQSFVRSHDVIALTPDGDRAQKKGGYHGGYFDPRNSKLDAYHRVTELRRNVEELREKQDEIRQEIDACRQQLNEAASEVRKAEYLKNHAEDGYVPKRQELRSKQTELQRKRTIVEDMERTLADLVSAVNVLGSQQSDLEDEIASDFKKALTRDEEELLQSLTSTVRDLRKQLAVLSEERSELEMRKSDMEVEVRENLQPSLDRLLEQQAGPGGSGNQSARLKDAQRQLNNINKTIADFDRRIEELESRRDEANARLAQLEEARAEKETSNRNLARAIERHKKGMEKSLQKRAQYRDELTAIQRDIRELGTLPDDAYQKYTRWSNDRLVTELDKANKALKKYSHVNKKAFQQYEDFTKRREALCSRRDDLNESRNHIETLIEVLDQRKDEAIARTFKQVAKYFKEVFVQLVPAGTGRLIIQRRSDREAHRGGGGAHDDSDDEHTTSGGKGNNKSAVENYTGVGIAVSFNSKHDEQQRIQQLSGGQKALCALALVFAIQQCDPAPFYLFDEIDANLDAQYRSAVAEMLRKLSGKGGESGEGGGQFICTTFRPEMVHVADKCYAVSYGDMNSKISVYSKERALEFVEESQRVAR